jgi:hypothetical protein
MKAWRAWTMGDVRRLGELRRAGLTYAEIAAEMGRPPTYLAEVWRRYSGLAKTYLRLTPRVAARLRSLAARGHHRAEAARRLGTSPATVAAWARRLGLTFARGPQGHRWGREHRRRHGHTVLEARRARCAALGWPEAPCVPGARVLSLLLAGPRTHAQLRDALGLRGCARSAGRSRHLGDLLRRMQALRLVVTVPGTGGPGRPKLYALAAWLRASRAVRD